MKFCITIIPLNDVSISNFEKIRSSFIIFSSGNHTYEIICHRVYSDSSTEPDGGPSNCANITKPTHALLTCTLPKCALKYPWKIVREVCSQDCGKGELVISVPQDL